MKLYNNSQKTPQSESLHKVKRNHKTPRQKKMKVYTAKITGGSVAASDMAGKNTPKTVLREYRENFHAQKHSSRQSIYTKATRIFLQHPILRLYTALFVEKGQCGLSSVSPQRRGQFCHNSCRTAWARGARRCRKMASHNPMSCAALPVTESPAPRPNSVWSDQTHRSTWRIAFTELCLKKKPTSSIHVAFDPNVKLDRSSWTCGWNASKKRAASSDGWGTRLKVRWFWNAVREGRGLFLTVK